MTFKQRTALLAKHVKAIKETGKRQAATAAFKGFPKLVRDGNMNRWETGKRLAVFREAFTRQQFLAFLDDCEGGLSEGTAKRWIALYEAWPTEEAYIAYLQETQAKGGKVTAAAQAQDAKVALARKAGVTMFPPPNDAARSLLSKVQARVQADRSLIGKIATMALPKPGPDLDRLVAELSLGYAVYGEALRAAQAAQQPPAARRMAKAA